MATESKVDSPESAKQTGQTFGGGPVPVRGGLVVGIATVVVIGVVRTVFSKFRKPNGLGHTKSLEKIVDETHVEEGNLSPHEAVINGKRLRDLGSPTGGSDRQFNSKTFDSEGHDEWVGSDFQEESSPEKIPESKLEYDLDPLEGKEGDDFSTTGAALAELVNHALLDSKHDNPSKHEFLNKTNTLQDGIAGVLARAFEDFTYGGDTSSDELTTPTKVTLKVLWETKSSSGFDNKAVVKVHTESAEVEFVADNADDKKIERSNHNAIYDEVSQDEVASEVQPESPHFVPLAKEEAHRPENQEGSENQRDPLEEEDSFVWSGFPVSEEARKPENEEGSDPRRDPLEERVLSVWNGFPVSQDKIDSEISEVLNDETQGKLVEEDLGASAGNGSTDRQGVPDMQQDKIHDESSAVPKDKAEEGLVEEEVEPSTVSQRTDIEGVLDINHEVLKDETERFPDAELEASALVQSNDPEVVPDAQQDRFESESSVMVKDDIKEVASLIDRTTKALVRTANGSLNKDEMVQKENGSPKAAQLHADIEADVANGSCYDDQVVKRVAVSDASASVNKVDTETGVSVTMTSILLTSTDNSPIKMPATREVDSVRISTQISEKETREVKVTSVVLPTTAHEVANVTSIVTGKSNDAARKTAIVTTVELFSSLGGGLKPEFEEKGRGQGMSLQMLGLAGIIALIAIVVWVMQAGDRSFSLRL